MPSIVGKGIQFMQFRSSKGAPTWLVAAALAGLSLSPAQVACADEQVPVPWNGMDIGGPSPAGGSRASNGTFTLTGGGALEGTRDKFHFVYQPLTGDCTLSARVTAGADPNSRADAGLMARDALATTSNFVAVALAPRQGVVSTYRTLCAPATDAIGANSGSPVWVKLIKRGTTVQSYMAADRSGVPGAWKQIGSSQPIASGMIYVGLCLTSHAQGTGGTATFDHIALVTGTLPALDDGVYTIAPAGTPGMVLAATGNAVNLASSAGSPSQKWRLVNKGSGFYSLQPLSDASLALTVPGAKSDFGTKVSITADQGLTSQVWSIVANSNGTYSLLPRFNTGIGLDDLGGNTAPNAVIDIWGYNSSDPHLQWTLNPAQ